MCHLLSLWSLTLFDYFFGCCILQRVGLGWTGPAVRYSGGCNAYLRVIFAVIRYVSWVSIRGLVLAQDLFMTRQERQDVLRRSLAMLGMQLEQFSVLAILCSRFLSRMDSEILMWRGDHIERHSHDTSLTQLDDTKLSRRVFSIFSSQDFQLQVCLPNVFADRAGPLIVNLEAKGR